MSHSDDTLLPDAAPARSLPAAAARPEVSWGSLHDEDLAELVRLGREALAVDGGLPLAGDVDFVRSRYLPAAASTLAASTGAATTLAASTLAATTVAARGADGRLIAAGALRHGPARDTTTWIGQVLPEARGQGLGALLLDRGLAGAAGFGGTIVVESETVTPAAQALFAARGFRQVFAEDVMGIDLGSPTPTVEPVPAPASAAATGDWPAGTTLADWSEATSARFHAVYEAAFRERPGFPGWSAQEWITDTEEDDGFRADWSVLAHRPGLGDVGFVTAAVGWIVQVGVAPGARGSGVGAALVREALRRMRADGATRALLMVNVDNPAAGLYRRIGFTCQGRRARFRSS